MSDRRENGLADRLAYLAYSTGWAATRRAPEPLARAVFGRLADLIWHRRGRHVRRLESNLARVCPGLSGPGLRALSRLGMRSYFRYWCEAFRLPAMTRAHILRGVVLHEEERFHRAVGAGRGVVCALPHLANWDLAGAWWGVGLGTPLTTVAERLRPVRLYDRFVDYRERLGMEVLALETGRANGGANGEVFSTLVRRLREGRVVALVADRDLSARGIDVEFFGETARMPPGPAALALRTGAPLLPVTLWYEGPRLHIGFGEPVPVPVPADGPDAVRAMTQQLADVFAAAVAAHPQDWHMLQRLWLADLPADRPTGSRS